MRRKLLFPLLLICFLFETGCGQSQLNSVCFSTVCFNVEVADTPRLRQKGLMHREVLGENEGMLFVFAREGMYGFWMKNTYIPLDMIWINKGKKVVAIKSNALPCRSDPCPRISPGREAQYVLEINAGLSEKYEIEVGDKVSF